jgi:hypothetical protein
MAMFVQVIEGKVADPELLRRQTEKWSAELKPGASGYLGSTSGITPDGRSILLARFDSEDAAKANNDRPEQGAWWAETAPAFDGEVTFHDCRQVDTMFGGGSNDAGFVQIIHGRARDESAMRARMAEMESELREHRPDILGGIVAYHGDGGFTQAVYFTSEKAAREAERQTEQEDMRDEYMAMFDGPPTFLDLPNPEFD